MLAVGAFLVAPAAVACSSPESNSTVESSLVGEGSGALAEDALTGLSLLGTRWLTLTVATGSLKVTPLPLGVRCTTLVVAVLPLFAFISLKISARALLISEFLVPEQRTLNVQPSFFWIAPLGLNKHLCQRCASKRRLLCCPTLCTTRKHP